VGYNWGVIVVILVGYSSIELEGCIIGFIVPKWERLSRERQKRVNGNVGRGDRNHVFPRSDTLLGRRQVIVRRQRYASGILGFWLDWFGLGVL